MGERRYLDEPGLTPALALARAIAVLQPLLHTP